MCILMNIFFETFLCQHARLMFPHLYLLNGLTRVLPNSSEKIRKRVQFYGHYITFGCWGRGGNFYLEQIYFVCSGCVLIQFKGAMSHKTNVLLSLSLAACQPRWGFRRGEGRKSGGALRQIADKKQPCIPGPVAPVPLSPSQRVVVARALCRCPQCVITPLAASAWGAARLCFHQPAYWLDAGSSSPPLGAQIGSNNTGRHWCPLPALLLPALPPG